MTEKLKQLLHERTEHVDFAAPDVDALARVGDRRVRRHRAGVLAGSLAAVALVGSIVVPQLRGGTDHTAVALDLPDRPVVSWASGDVIHTGSGDVEVGHEVAAYVRTADGFVVADPRGTVWSVTERGVADVGATDAKHPRLVSDDEGTLAGWVDSSGARPAFVVLDLATGDVTRNDDATSADMGTLADEQNPAYFYALDGHTAYWRDDRGAVAVDLDTRRADVVVAGARGGFDILDVEDDLIAFNAADRGTDLGTSVDHVDRSLPDAYGSIGAFSPNARYYSSDADQPQVYDVSTGERIEFDIPHGFATGYEWLDDSTLVMLAARRPAMSAHGELLRCTVPAGTCETAVPDLGALQDMAANVALPSGEPLG